MNNIYNLTVVILTYKTNEKILTDCLNSIDPRIKILIIENSKNDLFKENLKKKYPDLKKHDINFQFRSIPSLGWL